ncbi:ADP-ribosylglycohydrolase family protein [Reichenbachiella carrageenanivorans]|uniref:ADP-ribosylglycohydrolase family protein n=1 Tax=Reichenbachiella carrageenanivorans TaxID=2979869 RepID=A0ABY6DB18_9BACT|nr:ADP-ribosylglycohydrolase family protein [Reichenbachiella carrageenanivorans]UXX81035.1 ADP-ribosylglycohydrolase family protein [Reichenbachiella carrageenanivorans]
MQKITYKEYINKVRGGWIGKCAGGILGAPIEGFKTFNNIIIDDKLFDNNFPNDDLDLQILWLDMVKKKGPQVRTNDYKSHWKNHVDFPWNEYGIATLNIEKGLDNPDTGQLNNTIWNQSMGSPIRSEIWGMLCPGSPAQAAFYAQMDSTLDHTDFSVDAEMFFSAAAAMAFFNDDINSIMRQAAGFTSGGQTFNTLYHDICHWHKQFGEEITKHKIKSKYGDADFTSAPMNVGLTILSLLAFGNSFDDILKSINYGHDSDCIIATAAALIGIIKGYDAIPQIWKDRIGNDLMVSPEITGIDIPETVEELTEETCKIGLNFIEQFGDVQVEESDSVNRIETLPITHHLCSSVALYPDVKSGQQGKISISVESLTAKELGVDLKIESPVFEETSMVHFTTPALSQSSVEIPLIWKKEALQKIQSGEYTAKNLPYTISTKIEGEEAKHEKGIPFYGNWIMAGPFVTDDEALTPMNKKYPDHGLPSMPSVAYMNHDKVDRKTEFLSWGTISELYAGKTMGHPFESQLIFPKDHTFPLGDYFYGRGERTIYLLTQFDGNPKDKKWLCIGAAGYVRVWHNKKLCYTSDQIRRTWSMAHNAELKLAKQNEILIRIDFPVDQFDVMIGFKHHLEKHAHQSQWDAELIPTVLQ